ncbi:unnamed protein product [Nesidiocoris tenuis]|uniref:Uncharacterized protein n=1 Tax=Nesidiocoris tenuis TaxID=355587 RepID=A0A6H5H7B4_9HEMI|nr:unnamed protein product [Nesidiocoris tenuis]
MLLLEKLLLILLLLLLLMLFLLNTAVHDCLTNCKIFTIYNLFHLHLPRCRYFQYTLIPKGWL